MMTVLEICENYVDTRIDRISDSEVQSDLIISSVNCSLLSLYIIL